MVSQPNQTESDITVANSDNLVDFHCHLDLYPDFPLVISEANDAKVFTLAVTTTPRAWKRNQELTKDTQYVRAALGLHPQLIGEIGNEISLWEEYLPETRYVGEVGLDAGPRFYKSFDLQKQIFQQVLQRCAEHGDKILSVHSVRSAKIVLDYIESYLPASRGKVVLHWFTGSSSEAKRAVEMGCYFSINTQMLHGKNHKSLIKNIPIDRVLTETDGPFTQTENRPSKPTDVAATVEILSALYEIGNQDMVGQITANLRTLLTN